MTSSPVTRTANGNFIVPPLASILDDYEVAKANIARLTPPASAEPEFADRDDEWDATDLHPETEAIDLRTDMPPVPCPGWSQGLVTQSVPFEPDTDEPDTHEPEALDEHADAEPPVLSHRRRWLLRLRRARSAE